MALARLTLWLCISAVVAGLVRCAAPPEPSREGDGPDAAEARSAPPTGMGAGTGLSDAVRFEHLTIEDGLSQNAVYAIVQDRLGFVWLGTKDGLNRYDGGAFVVYRHDPFDEATLPSSFVTALLESTDGHLWVGTREGGVARLDPATGEVVRYANSPRAHVLDLAEDANGDLWVGTIDAGLYRLAGRAPDASVETFRYDPADPASLGHDRVEAVLADREGRLWIGTAAGLSRREDGGFVHFDVAPDGGGGDPAVSALTQSADGALWAATPDGLARVDDPATGRVTRFPYPPRLSPVWEWGAIEDLSDGPDGGLWAATHTTLSRFDPETGAHTYARHDPDDPTSLTGNNLQSLLWDRSGVLWIGTNGYGASLYDAKSARFGTLGRPAGDGSGWSAFSARAIFEDRDGRVWVNASERLYVEDEPGGTLAVFEPIDGAINAIGPTNMVQDREGVMWFTSQRGLHRYDPETGRTRLYRHDPEDPESLLDPHSADQIRGVFEDREGAIWVVTHHYLSRLDDPEAGRFRHLPHTARDESRSLSATYFLSLHEDARGRFWIATDTGLLRVDPATGESTRYRTDPGDPASLSHDLVRAVLPDPETPDRVLWIGTGGGGLNRFDVETETFQHITTADGLPNNVVYGVLPDDAGRLWLSTNRGLARYDPRTGAVQTYDARDGLQSNEFNTGSFHRGVSGRLYFGGIYGVNVFDPDAITDNPHVPSVVLTGLRIGDRPVAVGDSTGLLDRALWATDALRLSHRENMVTFSFAALDFSAPQKNRYAYRMEGFDDGWIQAGTNRTATYTNLPPGRYTFRVRGSNNDGVWNEAGAALAVVVAPPPWRSWWAYLAYVLLGAGVVAAVYRNRQDRLRLRHRLEIEHLEAETLRDLDRAKSQFFANVSHEFRTPLTLTLGPLDDVLAGEYGPVPDEAAEPIGLARRSAGRVLRLISQILDVSKLEAGHTPLRARVLDLGAFVEAQVEAFVPLGTHRQIAVEVVAPDALEVWADPGHLGTILTNLLSNAFKFTPGGGTVTVEVGTVGGGAYVTVRDTGRGIAEADLPHVFDRFYQAEGGAGRPVGSGIGLALAHDLADLHGGTLTVESTVGKGSAFVLTVPLGTDHLASEQIDDEPWHGTVPALALALDEPAAPPSPSAPPIDDVTTVLVVDNERDIRAYVRRHLEGAGYHVVEATDGEDALERVRHRLPDLVVSDVMMPRLDGLGLCRALRSDPETDFVPVLLLTAKAAPEDRLDGLAELCDDYLTKPFDVRELVARVGNLIALRHRLRERFEGPAGDGAPEAPPAVWSVDDAFEARVRSAIEARLGDDDFNVAALAEAVGLSRSHLLRRTTALMGATPSDLIRVARLDQAAHLLATQAGTVSEVAYGVGFKSVAHFSNAFLAHTGTRPSAYAEAAE